MADQICMSYRDQSAYRVLRVEKEKNSESEHYGKKVVRLERVEDGYQDSFPESMFESAFKMMNEREANSLLQKFLKPELRERHAIPDQSSEPEFQQAEEQTLEKSSIGILIEPDETDDFTKMVCYPAAVEQIHNGLNKIRLQEFLDNDWGLKEVSSKTKQSILNFNGPPGTGKTMMARAVSRMLHQKLLLVNYAELESKWVGETGKHISQVFAEAKRLKAILFWDEADTMMSARISNADDAVSKGINANRNILMQEMDRHQGVMIVATNFVSSFDEAMVRRISEHVYFDLPNEEMREQLLRLKIPAKVPTEGVNFKALAKQSEGFSGDDIRKLCENAMVKAASMFGDSDKNRRVLRQEYLLESLARIKAEKVNHKGGARKVMGFHADR